MNHKKVLGLATAVLTVLLCAALCASAALLYRQGMARRAEEGTSTAPVFTPEGVGRQLLRISPLAGLWLLALIIALVTDSLATREQKAAPDPAWMLRLLRSGMEEMPPAARREQAFRRKASWASGLLAGAGGIAALLWLGNRANFTDWDLEKVMGDMLLHAGIPLLFSLFVLLAGALLRERSMGREEKALLEARKERKAARAPAPPMAGISETPARRGLRLALYLLGAALAAAGIINGGLKDVLIKAINICTECIGLG